MEIITMNYNEDDYQRYYQDAVEMLGNIRLSKLKFVHKLEGFKEKEVTNSENINDSMIGAFMSPVEMPENTNNVIETININQQLLAASYSLLKLQQDEIDSIKSEDKPSKYFWFVFYFEDTINRISTLNDLLWNLVNYLYEFHEKESLGMKTRIRKRLERDKHGNLISILDNNKYTTNIIRNDSVHNTKPFLYKGAVTVKNGIVAIGEGKREFNFDQDMYKVEADIQLLSEKYQSIIAELNLETLQ